MNARSERARAGAPRAHAPLTLEWVGVTHDRVPPAPQGQSDGHPDAEFKAVLGASVSGPVVTLFLGRQEQSGMWDTDPGSAYWLLGVARESGGPLVNAADGRVSVEWGPGQPLYLYASGYPPGASQPPIFTEGARFTLTATFANGATAEGSVTIPATPPPVTAMTVTLTQQLVATGVGESTVAGPMHFTLGANVTVDVPVDESANAVSVAIDNVAPGTYEATAVRLADDGSTPIGATATTTVVVGEGAAMVKAATVGGLGAITAPSRMAVRSAV